MRYFCPIHFRSEFSTKSLVRLHSFLLTRLYAEDTLYFFPNVFYQYVIICKEMVEDFLKEVIYSTKDFSNFSRFFVDPINHDGIFFKSVNKGSDHLAHSLGGLGRFLGSQWDRQLKFSAYVSFLIWWSLSKFELI